MPSNPKCRIALCLYGIYTNRYSSEAGEDGAQYIKETIIKNRDVDVFAYSTDLKNENRIKFAYKDYLKLAEFKKQKTFKEEMQKYAIDESIFISPGRDSSRTITNSLSFFYSRKRVIELKKQYEKENNFKYDIVIVSRFDLGQLDKYYTLYPYKCSQINFNENFDMNYIYSAMWDQMNCGYGDQWFYSNSENIDKLALMYDKSLEYFQKESSYIKSITNGLIDSNIEDEFSNEFLKPQKYKSKNLVKYDITQAHNNHLMHKWFFIELGLYNKSKFVNNIDDVCNILYTHSSKAELWPIYFGQMEKYFNAFSKNVVFIDKYCDEIPKYCTQIIYNNNIPYSQKILSCLSQINGQEMCFFTNESVVLCNFPIMDKIRKYIDLMNLKKGLFFKKNKFDFIQFINDQCIYNSPIHVDETLFSINFSQNLLITEPILWNTNKFIEFLKLHKNSEVQENTYKIAKKMKLKGLYSYSNKLKKHPYASINDIYPYIKLKSDNTQQILSEILNEYRDNINEVKLVEKS